MPLFVLRRLPLAGLLLLAAASARAQTADCRFSPPAAARSEVAWQGACKDGYAEGKGVLSWTVPGAGKGSLEGTLVRGNIHGEATLKRPDGGKYIGTFTDGVPDGKGFFQDPDGMLYEGDVRNGERTGTAEAIFPSGDQYVGEWLNGKPHGRGRMVYTLGGAYDGQWHTGVRHGHGVLTYAGSGRRFEGEFDSGRIAGSGPRPEPGKTYNARTEHTASRIGFEVVRNSPVPTNVGYAAFTPEQKAVFDAQFPALEEGDEPPYPVGGTRQFFEYMSRVSGRLGGRGELALYVNVAADGTVESVRASGNDDPELRHYAGTGAGVLKYKPAVCRGKPCAMTFPLRFTLGR